MILLMIHVATLVRDPCAPALDEATVPACALPGMAADVFFTPDPDACDRAATDTLRPLLGEDLVDVVVQRAAHRRKKLLVADMDSSLIGQEGIDELADSEGGGPRACRPCRPDRTALRARLCGRRPHCAINSIRGPWSQPSVVRRRSLKPALSRFGRNGRKGARLSTVVVVADRWFASSGPYAGCGSLNDRRRVLTRVGLWFLLRNGAGQQDRLATSLALSTGGKLGSGAVGHSNARRIRAGRNGRTERR
jgi:hypothetical protein